jgi:KDO2-lipid IV(A) lauroyltransferase
VTSDGASVSAGGAASPQRVLPEVRGRLLVLGASILERLPEGPLFAAADALGELWYRTAPRRAAQARANLGRVCEALAATGRGTPAARRAAADPDALERLVRAAFRHAARYYVEVARTGAYDIETALSRIDVETPDEVHAALSSGRPIMLVGMHFGAIELPVVEVSHLVGHRVTAPMEAVVDPVLQRWFLETRGRVGVTIVPLIDARRTLLRALRRGESVGMVADRDILGNGLLVPFFGHPAPIPAGPALIAVEAGVPLYVGAARRTRDRRYRGRLILVPAPEGGTRRQRVTALTAAMAQGFESLLADAPEQWWGAFHPVWPDLAVDRDDAAPSGDAAAPATPAGDR